MKKIIVSAIILTSLLSCEDLKENEAPMLDTTMFEASMEDFSADTKTFRTQRNNIVWSEGDNLAVFQGCSVADKYQLIPATAGTSNGKFTIVSDNSGEVNGDFDAGMEITANIAFYPYAEGLSCVKAESEYVEDISTYSVCGFFLPKVQKYVYGSFSESTFPMLAVTENMSDHTLKFKNICGVINLQFVGKEVIKSIKIVGQNDEKLSGLASVTTNLYNLNPEVRMSPDALGEVVLDCANGVQLREDLATEFIITLPPVEFSKGFIVTITDINGKEFVVKTDQANTISRSAILMMPEIVIEMDNADLPPKANDYIDEYGINHGQGVEIDNVVWAPVNCGYHETDYPYGKLYQWGRRYGQGNSGELYDYRGNVIGKFSDASVPEEERECGVSLGEGQSVLNMNVIYKFTPAESFIGAKDWLEPTNHKLWNSGTEESPVKTDCDPCPKGWRVPTRSELYSLSKKYSSFTQNEKGQNGYYFYGENSYDTMSGVFFPAAGTRGSRGNIGCYWSSTSRNAMHGAESAFLRGVEMYTDYGQGGGLHYQGYSVRCVQCFSDLVTAVSLELNHTSLKLYENDMVQLQADVQAAEAGNRNIEWKSSDSSVATVDQQGNVRAVSPGRTDVSIEAGGLAATCSIVVYSQAIVDGDYVDEYGVNHGQGVEIDNVVWAPVNCGYHETDYPYGKLYQWGRKHGQGYSGGLYDSQWNNYIEDLPDARTPEFENGGVSMEIGQSVAKKNVFFIGSEDPCYDWVSPQGGSLWNMGSLDSPEKTEYDPCPDGWRIPIEVELDGLIQNSVWSANENGQSGRWFSGSNIYSSDVPQVFFPAAGCRDVSGESYDRGYEGYYWSSGVWGVSYGLGASMHFYLGAVYSDSYPARSNGFSVRCVKGL